ncbi:uncharacterized protein RAG0_01745 [Rhynchosporium agropyri]|uniref:Tat pathway signal sequence n=1 Tax=Rhynchosporium agropyri TaxID=914238 RepID=A0A1E1JY93_9HELO|nr:uncharacterized protein RAG0_01745 [Rhynchosporium agropyri]
MNFPRLSSYKPLSQSESANEQTISERPWRATIYKHIGWVVASFFAFSTVFLLLQSPRIGNPQIATSVDSFRTGFSTEFDPIKPHIKEQSTMFWGGPRWYDNGTSYRLRNPSEPTYVGPPSQEIDTAWEVLLKNRYFSVTEEEAELTFGKSHGLYNHPNGVGYLLGLDVFHALHCVEQLRRALDRDHYFNKETKLAYPDRDHRDHCLDHIRQQLMCHADLTPIPVIWYEGHGRSFVQSDVVHTCRNWDAVHDFVSSRP